MTRVAEVLGIDSRLPWALDAGCGTGLSSRALLGLAENVTAFDLSESMLHHAHKDPHISYSAANGELLPYRDSQFDLVTISQAIHWLDRGKFLSETRRVLKPGGYLIIYDNYITDEMADEPAYHDWFRNEYLVRYPTPPRNWAAFTPEEAVQHNFKLIHSEKIENTIPFTLDEFVDFLMTITNVIAAIEGGRETEEETREWLRNGLIDMFDDEEQVIFTAPIWILKPLGI